MEDSGKMPGLAGRYAGWLAGAGTASAFVAAAFMETALMAEDGKPTLEYCRGFVGTGDVWVSEAGNSCGIMAVDLFDSQFFILAVLFEFT